MPLVKYFKKWGEIPIFSLNKDFKTGDYHINIQCQVKNKLLLS